MAQCQYFDGPRSRAGCVSTASQTGKYFWGEQMRQQTTDYKERT
jgi:hypothetical protein